MTSISKEDVEALVAELEKRIANAERIIYAHYSGRDAGIDRQVRSALTSLQARLTEVERDLDQCHAKSTCMCGSYVSQHGIGDGHSPVSMYDYALDQARTRLSEVEKALEFYADPSTYFAIGILPDPPCGDFITDFDEDHEEAEERGFQPGKRARAALRSALTPKGE